MSKLDKLSKAEPVAWRYRFKTERPVFMLSKRDWAKQKEWVEAPLYTTDPRPLIELIRQLGDALAFYMTPPIGQLNDHHIEAAKMGMVALKSIVAFDKEV